MWLIIVSVGDTFFGAPVTVVVSSNVSVSLNGAPVAGSGVVGLILSVMFLLVVVFLHSLCWYWSCCCH